MKTIASLPTSRAACQFVDGCDVEVWLLDRKIGRLTRAKK
jgi:hypothetical protein